MSSKVNYSLIMVMTALLIAVLGLSYFVFDAKEEAVMEEKIEAMQEDPARVFMALQDSEEYCALEDELEAANAKIAEQQAAIDQKLQEIINLRSDLKTCRQSLATVRGAENTEAEDLRAILVNMTDTEAELPDRGRPEPPVDDKSAPEVTPGDEIPRRIDPIGYDQPLPVETEFRRKNTWDFGASIAPGVGVIDRDFTIGAGVHAIVNNNALFGVEYLFGEDILLTRVGWLF